MPLSHPHFWVIGTPLAQGRPGLVSGLEAQVRTGPGGDLDAAILDWGLEGLIQA